MSIGKINIYNYLTLILVIGLILIKYNTLSLPYFWDEAWPYATGIHLMHNDGLSLLPGAISFEISRGHPLLFHFSSAAWMRIFGNTIFISHIFPLLISCSLIYMTYFTGKTFFSPAIGFFSTLTLSIQPVFLAQSSMLLPEIMLATLSLVTLYFYITEKKILFVVSATSMLLTKESGIVLLAAFIIKESIACLSKGSRIQFKKEYLIRISLVLIPIFLSFTFFILQKIKTGNFFLPLYTAGDNFILSNIYNKFISYSSFLFIYQGRNGLSTLLILSLIFIFIASKKILIIRRQNEIIFLLFIFIILFLIFSASNFYSPRYLLNILPIFILVTYYFFFNAFKKIKWVLYTGLLIVISAGSLFCLQKKFVDDHNLSYTDAINVSEDAVKFCEQNNLFQSRIFANFLMRTYLTNSTCGYLKAGRAFTNVSYEFTKETEYVIMLNYEKDDFIESVSKRNDFSLINRFERSIAWCEIYKRK